MKTNLSLITWAALFMLLSALNSRLSNVLGGPVVATAAVGGHHILFSESDGSLWVMGDNTFGQLGLGQGTAQTNTPVQVISSGVARVAAGTGYSLFRVGHDVWAMGANDHGQLGDGTTNNHFFPEKSFLGNVLISATVLAAGDAHSLFGTFSGAVATNIGLRVMGNNLAGQLGDGTYTDHLFPEQVESITGISSVAAGSYHSLYVKSDGSLWGMGDNSFGELGLGSLSETNMQVQIVSSGVLAVAAGSGHSLYVKSDGSLWSMGLNTFGQLGNNTTIDQHTPIQVAFNGVTAVAAGEAHSLYIKSDGSLWGMGYNGSGQLGDGTRSDRQLAIQIVPSNVVAVAAGGDHSLYIKSDGSLWGMGLNSSGELGGTSPSYLTPVQIVGGTPPPPLITAIIPSQTNLNLSGSGGIFGEVIYTLMGTNLTVPPSQWLPVATNDLDAYGDFAITVTNSVVPNASQRFFILQAQ
jgi:alpha-tubulin suppressor-like RCC1 family protein